MEIIVGKYSGFCNGVNYTVTKTIEELSKYNTVYSLGDVVHNNVVMEGLKNKGLIVTNDISSIPDHSRVIIRAHGETLDTYHELEKKNIDIIDLTCGKVKLIHTKILKHKDDSFIIIVGKKNHPETIAHKSYSGNSFVVENENDIENAHQRYYDSKLKSVYIVSQTTFNEELFYQLIQKIKEEFTDSLIEIDNTICNTTSIRQNEVKEISKKVNKMIVIGGKNSSNTKELANISINYCPNVYLVQTIKDLQTINFNKDDIIGVTAGASTPVVLINDVVDYLESLYSKKK